MNRVTLCLIVTWLAVAACGKEPSNDSPAGGIDARGGPPLSGRDSLWQDSAARAFGDTVVGRLLDTRLFELKGELFVKIKNPNKDDAESPLYDQPVDHPAAPGPHTYTGALTAEIGALRKVLGDGLPVKIEEDRVYVGNPEVLIRGHHHGAALYVPVKLFARQYGAYVDISCTLSNCGFIWTPEIVQFMLKAGYTGSAGVLEGFAEGLLKGVDVRKQPGG